VIQAFVDLEDNDKLKLARSIPISVLAILSDELGDSTSRVNNENFPPYLKHRVLAFALANNPEDFLI